MFLFVGTYGTVGRQRRAQRLYVVGTAALIQRSPSSTSTTTWALPLPGHDGIPPTTPQVEAFTLVPSWALSYTSYCTFMKPLYSSRWAVRGNGSSSRRNWHVPIAQFTIIPRWWHASIIFIYHMTISRVRGTDQGWIYTRSIVWHRCLRWSACFFFVTTHRKIYLE